MSMTDTRWDESAARVLKISREMACDIGGNAIATEHLLLGLVRETPVEENGIEALHFEAVYSAAKWAFTPTITFTHGCQTPRYRHALEAAAKSASGESRPISRQDLWHGLFADKEAFGLSVLDVLGIREQVRRRLG